MTRVKYKKSRYKGLYHSKGHISLKYGTRYDVFLDTINYNYYIKNITSNRVVKKVQAKAGIKYPIHSLKIKIKQDLKKLFVRFGAEVRSSRE